MTFGGYNLTKYADGPIIWHTASTEYNYWNLELINVTFEFKQTLNQFGRACLYQVILESDG